jgi:hypothetical protein
MVFTGQIESWRFHFILGLTIAAILGQLHSLPRAAVALEMAQAQSGVSTPEIDVEDPGPAILPDAVKTAVLQTASAQVGLPAQRFTLVKAVPKIWSDGCLGLAEPGQMCTAVLVKGWQVTLAANRQEWVYRTNTSGSAIKYDQAAGRLSQQVKPAAETMSADQLPPKLERSVLFRQLKSGGIAGINQEIRLYKDGRLVQVQPGGQPKSSENVLRRLPKGEVKGFRKVLEQSAFGQFDKLRYPAPSGSADYFTVTLSTRRITTQYADLAQENLPRDLKVVMAAWQKILNGR